VAFVAYRHDGTRDFLYHIAHAAAGQIDSSMLSPAAFDGLKCLHVMGSTLSMHADALAMGMRALEMARTAGAKVSFDPNLRPQLMSPETARLAFYPLMLAADVILPTVEEIRLMTGEVTLVGAVSALMRPGRIIVVTEGAAGCVVFTDESPQGVHVPGFPVEEVDPTGAGDCFDAGFLVRWLEGAHPVEAARFANACGALAVTRKGPAEGAMPRSVVEQFLRDHLP
jgi:sugar/nucleoside kinase (ribokinase family)